MVARMPIMAITMRSSINVNPDLLSSSGEDFLMDVALELDQKN